jgi:hypothetical protein
MSYHRPIFLTLVVMIVALLAGPLAAQRDRIKRELPHLASPAAFERAAAASRIAAIEGDIAADLRLAWGIADLHERIGLLQAARMRQDGALIQQGAAALSDPDERLSETVRDYLMVLPFDTLQPDLSQLDAEQSEAWDAFRTFRVQRDVAQALLVANLMPGKYFGQFESLRDHDEGAVDDALAAFMRADAAVAEPLELAAIQTIESDGPPGRAFQSTFRRLASAAGGFDPALEYLRTFEVTDELEHRIRRTPRSRYLAALEVYAGVRAGAVRALAGSRNAEGLTPPLLAFYDTLNARGPAPELTQLVNP